MTRLISNNKRWERPRVKIKGNILSKWIDNSPLSKSDIAELLGCTRRTINRWIAGTRSPRTSDQKRLIDLTTLGFWELFEEK
jgi:transcriptional regulator with XRE-family HTH domain